MTDKHVPVKSYTGTASQAVATRLIRLLIQGRYAPGARLPAERDMAKEHQVSRHVVREALKQLEALGLIEIHQGSGVYAHDILLSGGMEIFTFLLFDAHGQVAPRALFDLLVFCRLFMPNVLRLAAENRTPAQVKQMRQALAARPTLISDTAGLTISNLQLLRCIANATDNQVYQLLFNNLGRWVMQLRTAIPLDVLAPVVTQNDLEHLLQAIETRDAELAGLLGQRFSERAEQITTRFLTDYDENDKMPNASARHTVQGVRQSKSR